MMAPLRPGSRRYEQYWEQQRRAIDQWGVRVRPSPALVAEARKYGTRLWEERGHPGAPPRVRERYIRHNTEGILGAELFANYYGVRADWTIYPRADADGDGGWDVDLPTRPTITVDAKTRAGFLTVARRDITLVPNYYALVQHLDCEPDYVLCGVITPLAFGEKAIPMEYNGDPVLGVTAFALIGLPYFHTELRP